MIQAKGIFLVPTVGVIDEIVEQGKMNKLIPGQQKHFDDFLHGIEQEVRQR